MKSIKSRISYATIFLLLCCAGILAMLLINTFKKTLIISEKQRLEGIVYTTLSMIDVMGPNQVWFDDKVLSESSQGAVIVVTNQNGQIIWPKNNFHKKLANPEIGNMFFTYNKEKEFPFTLSFGFSWNMEFPNRDYAFALHVFDKGITFEKQMVTFIQKLYTWLGIGCLILIILQVMMLHWGFTPLSKVSKEIQEIEKGKKHSFDTKYPSEIEPLAQNINSLLRHERSQQLRFRQALDNLAHALKTPLAALKTLVEDHQNTKDFVPLSEAQLGRMRSMIDYQLQKASTMGKSPFTKPISVHSIVASITASLQKVYAQKKLQFEVEIEAQQKVKIDEGDLFEVLGNVIENAAKFGQSHVRISWQDNQCIVEDDGKGIDPKKLHSIIQRGVRLDQRIDGSGIGLSIAYEIMQIYGGTLQFETSDLGGAKVHICFS